MMSVSCPIGDRTYTVHGASADLVEWLRESRLIGDVLAAADVSSKDFFAAFGATEQAERVAFSKQIIRKLWAAHPELGPYPFLETLSRFEFDRLFYPTYRDHVCHQLKVYLLGVMAYEGCPPLRDAIDQTLDVPARGTGEFLIRWLVTAVYHDIGYVLENEQANEPMGRAWIATKTRLNEVLAAPLSHVDRFAARLPTAVERHLINSRQIFTLKIDTPAELDDDAGIDPLEQIRREAELAGLGDETGRSPQRKYYDYALAHAPMDRPRFRDHGIASALLLLRSWCAFRDHVKRLEPHSSAPALHDVRDALEQLRRRLDAAHDTVRSAAAAMSLHNVNAALWDPADTVAYGLRLDRFKIRLRDRGRRTPLAFLLGLVDSLQDWDRPTFRLEPSHGQLDQDMSIAIRDGKLGLHIVKDAQYVAPQSNAASLFSKARRAMHEYLDPEAIDELVVWAPPPTNERTKLFANAVRRHQAMHGVGPVTAAQQQRRRRTYRFAMVKDQVRRVELINGSGYLVEDDQGIATWQHRYDQDGQLVEIEALNRARQIVTRTTYAHDLREEAFYDRYGRPRALPSTEVTRRSHEFDQRGFTVEQVSKTTWDEPSCDDDGAVAFRYACDDHGLHVRAIVVPVAGIDHAVSGLKAFERAYDAFGNETYYLQLDMNGTPRVGKHGYAIARWKYDVVGNLVHAAFFDANDRPTWVPEGYSAWRVGYDPRGNQIEVVYLDTSDQPTPNNHGVARSVSEFDSRGNVTRQLYFHSAGRRTFHEDGYAGFEATYDERGLQTSVCFLDTDHRPTLIKMGVARVRRTFDERGNQVREEYFDVHGIPCLQKEGVASWRCIYNARDQETRRRYFGIDGSPVLHKDGTAGVAKTYDERGNQAAVDYLGLDDAPSVHQDGVAGWRSEFDKRGNELMRRYVDAAGKPAFHKDGFAGVRKTFDARGNLTSIVYLGVDNAPSAAKDGYAEARCSYDAFGSVTGVEYLDAAGRPTRHRDGQTSERRAYNERGRLQSVIYLDAMRRPTLHAKHGVAGMRLEYDARDREVARSFFGVDERPAAIAGGHASERYTLDERGHRTGCDYFGPTGQPAVHVDGCSSWRATYDELGRERERRFFDDAGRPVRCREGYASASFTLDARGRAIEARYFGPDGQPCLHVKGFSVKRLRYDERGHLTEERYFDTEENPVLDREGVAGRRIVHDARGRIKEYRLLGVDGHAAAGPRPSELRHRHDDRGNLIEVTYYDADGARVLHPAEGIAGWRAVFDERGNETERHFFGLAGETKLHSTAGYAGLRRRFDARGDQIEASYLDADGKPTPPR